jgi:predicted HTH transcriptional regulator
MTTDRSAEYLAGLVRELCALSHETEWVEFKVNNTDPQEIGEYLSALANAAALNGKAFAYLIWGVEDQNHHIVGTNFSPSITRKGNEPLESWLLRLLTPKIHFRFNDVIVDGKAVVLLEIGRAYRHPVRFQGQEFIRIGAVKKPLKDAPDRERTLWRIFDQMPFENLIALERANADDVLRLLDYPAYFDLLEQPLPTNQDGIIKALTDDALIHACEAGGWNITNLGAILFAKRLTDFSTLRRKAVRVIQYRDTGRTETLREQEEGKGYASGFAGLIGYINGLLPTNEVIGQALRKTVPMYPELAVRELVANAIIHQDFFVTGAGPLVEVFSDRIEITNPGEPLVDTRRFVDTPPKSRNDGLASLMRRFRICEERGSGIDKVVFQVELFQLPAPLFETPEGFTRAVLFAHKPLSAMDKAHRVRACYLHACLRYVMRQPMTNASTRERFGIEEKNAALASRLLNEAVDDGIIVIRDQSVGTRSRSYLPYWAAPSSGDAGLIA